MNIACPGWEIASEPICLRTTHFILGLKYWDLTDLRHDSNTVPRNLIWLDEAVDLYHEAIKLSGKGRCSISDEADSRLLPPDSCDDRVMISWVPYWFLILFDIMICVISSLVPHDNG
jgi:hypothetical protein